MRMRIMSACVVLALIIVPTVVVAAGVTGSVRPAEASIRIASSTTVTMTAPASAAAVRVTAARHAARNRYIVQPGDTLSGIADRFAVPGGWPALYAANRAVIGPDPGLIRPGTVLVLPGRATPVRYTITAGDTLSGIADRFDVTGGWPALYAANHSVIGPNPNLIRAGTVLTMPRPAVPAHHATRQGAHRFTRTGSPIRRHQPPRAAPAPLPPVSTPAAPPAATPPRTSEPAAPSVPQWLIGMLQVAGVLIFAAFLTEPALAAIRRRRAATPSEPPADVGPTTPQRRPEPAAPESAATGPDTGPGQAWPAISRTGIVMADYDQLVITHCPADDTIYVLRPPGQNPETILKAARLVLAEGPYQALTKHLGLPASWPFLLADHHRLVVTRHGETVCVLRPPGLNPETVLKAARLVLPEDSYEELADQLGIPASWPMRLWCARSAWRRQGAAATSEVPRNP